MVDSLKSAVDVALSAHHEYEQERNRARREAEEQRKRQEQEERNRAETAARRRLSKSLLAEWFPSDTHWEYVETWEDHRNSMKWDVWSSGDSSRVGGQVQLMTNSTPDPSAREVKYVQRFNDKAAFRSERWYGMRVRSLVDIGRFIQDRIDEHVRASTSVEVDR